MRRPSGSTRHDASSRQPLRCRAPLPLATSRPRRHLSATIRFAPDGASNTGGSQWPTLLGATIPLHRQPSLHSSELFASVQRPAHYREIPIALAAPSSPHYSRVPSLEAFGRRPRCQPDRRNGPASETLHTSGCVLTCCNARSLGQICPRIQKLPVGIATIANAPGAPQDAHQRRGHPLASNAADARQRPSWARWREFGAGAAVQPISSTTGAGSSMRRNTSMFVVRSGRKRYASQNCSSSTGPRLRRCNAHRVDDLGEQQAEAHRVRRCWRRRPRGWCRRRPAWGSRSSGIWDGGHPFAG